MADRRISDLNPAPSTLNDTNTLFAVEQARTAYRVDGHTFIEAIVGIYEGHGGIADIEYTEPSSGSLEGTLTITLADQTTEEFTITNGRDIANITQYFAVNNSSSTVPSSSSWSTTRQTMTNSNRYLWSYFTFTFNDGTSVDTPKSIIGVYGDTGNAWYVWIRYAATCSGNPPMPPTDQDIGTDPDNWIGIYSGTASTAPTTRGSYTWFDMKGDKGDTGDSIDSLEWTSGTHAPGTNDTYTAYANGTAIGSFQVYNGQNGQGAPGSQTPIMDGIATTGTAIAYSREDHVHPTDTSRASQIDLNTAQSAITSLQTSLSSAIIMPTRVNIPSSGQSSTWTIPGLTSNHRLIVWGFSASGENAPPCDLSWETGYNNVENQFRVTNNGGTTSESIRPVFVLPTDTTAT